MLPNKPTAQQFFRPKATAPGQSQDFGLGQVTAGMSAPAQAPTLSPASLLRGSWDYKTASTGRNGEPLPPGAKAWTPMGTPYFGDGTFIGDVLGKLKEYQWNFTKDYTPPPDGVPTWEIVKKSWNEAFTAPEGNKPLPAGATLGQKFQEAGKVLKEQSFPKLFKALDQTWQLGVSRGEQSGALQPVFRGLTTGLQALFDIAQQGAAGVEAGIGAEQGLIKSNVESPLPKWDNATAQMLALPLVIGYNVLRTALSPSPDRWRDTQEGWQTGKVLWTRAWNLIAGNVDAKVQAGNIFYTQTINDNVKEEFVRRMRAGENPDLLAMELANPLAEMVGQLAVDPLNALGVANKGAKAERIMQENADLITHTGALANPEIADVVSDLSRATDLAQGDARVARLTQAQMTAAEATRSGMVQGYSPTSLIATGNQEKMLKNNGIALQGFLNEMSGAGYTTDDMGRMFMNGVMSVSDNAREVQQGALGLLHAPSPSRLFSAPYQTLFLTARNLMKDEDGLVDAAKFLNKFKGDTLPDFVDNMAKMLEDSVKAQYPTVDEMFKASEKVLRAGDKASELPAQTQKLAKAYEDVPTWVKKFTGAAQPEMAVKGFVNKQLGTFYFGLQYSVAARNITNNTVQILVDQGTGVFFRDGKFWSLGALKEDAAGWLGSPKPFGGAGFEDFANELGMTGPQVSEKGLKAIASKLTPRAVMSGAETDAGLRVFMKQFTQTMKRFINPKFMGGDILSIGGWDIKQQNRLMSLLFDTKGDAQKAAQLYRELNANGSVDAWRMAETYLRPEEFNHLDELGLRSELSALLNNPNTTPDDVNKWVDDTIKAQMNRANMTTGDTAGVSDGYDGGLDIQALQDAVERGDIEPGDNQVLAAFLQDANNASGKYKADLEHTFNLVLKDNGADPEIQKLVDMKESTLGYLDKHGQETRMATNQMRVSTKTNYDLIKSTHKPELAWLQTKWKQFGIAGEPPEALTKKQLISALWAHYRSSVANAWNDHFSGVFAGSDLHPSAEDMMKEMGKYTDKAQLEQDFQEAQKSWARAQAYRTGSFKDGINVPTPGLTKEDISVKTAEIEALMNKATDPAAIKKYQQQLVDIGHQMEAAPTKVPPPYVEGAIPSVPRAMKENLSGTLDMLENVRNSIKSRWGQKIAAPLGGRTEQTLNEWIALVNKRMPEAKFIAQKTASYWRDFALHAYGEKTYLDLAASFVYPYQFWYSRTYSKWLQRVVTDPQIIAGYAKYKTYMAQVHAESPDWYKQQVNIGELIGLDKNHPLYFNLEANLWPLYGLTGVDFNDHKKRVSWWTSTLDDMNKMGPSVWAPIQIATAVGLLTRGQTDAASRWGGRLIPETATLKALYNLSGANFLPNIPGTGLKYGELDPSVNLFSGGLDPYERGRVGAAMADDLQKQLEQVMNTPSTPEMKNAQIGTLRAQYLSQANSQSGDLWDKAVREATNIRAPGQLSSYLFGVGMKARTGTDSAIDDMYAKLNQIYLMRDSMSPEQYRKAYSDLGQQFPFMDTVLLSRKGGPERDAAYAYNVIGRIPPGDTTALLKTAGLSSADIDKFFASKGFTDQAAGFTESQRQKFMAAIQDLGAVLKLPPDADRAEWDSAKGGYQKMISGVDDYFGSDILNTVNAYYDLQSSGDTQKAMDFKLQHPEIVFYLQAKQEAILSDPTLAKYYGSLDTMEQYVENTFKLQMFKKYGTDILQKQAMYYDLKDYNSNYEAKKFLKAHPELIKYWADNRNTANLMNLQIIRFSRYLPAQPITGPRTDFEAQNVTQGQIAAQLGTTQTPSWERVASIVPAPLQKKILEYFQTGTPLSTSAMSEMNYLASANGFYNGEDFLRYAGASLWSLGQ